MPQASQRNLSPAGIDVEATIAEIMKKGSLTLKQRTLADLMDCAWGSQPKQ